MAFDPIANGATVASPAPSSGVTLPTNSPSTSSFDPIANGATPVSQGSAGLANPFGTSTVPDASFSTPTQPNADGTMPNPFGSPSVSTPTPSEAVPAGAAPFTVQHGTIPGADAVIQDVGNAAQDTQSALFGNASSLVPDSNPIGKTIAQVADVINPLGWAAKIGGAVVNGVAGMANDVVSKGLPFLPQTSAPAIGTDLRNLVGAPTADSIGNKIVATANSPIIQNATTELTPAMKDIGAVGKVASLFGTVAGGAEAGQGVSDLGAAVKAGTLPPVVQDVVSGVGKSIAAKASQAEQDAWLRPSTKPAPSYSNARDIVAQANAQGHNIGTTLINDGVRVGNNIEDGRYNTTASASQVRTTAAQMSNDMMRPALTEADTYTPKTPVQTIVDKTIQQIKSNPNNSDPIDLAAQVQRAQKEGAILQSTYPDGMSLTNMHDERITAGLNGGYSPTGDIATNIKANTNRAFGTTLANTLDSTVPNNLGYSEFNNELSKQFQTADYLDSLNGKPVPLGATAKIAKVGGQIGGVLVGNQLLPGIVGDIMGYRLGGMLESTIQNLPDTIRVKLLSNLQTSNPEAFSSLEKYMQERVATRATQLALPAPSPLGSAKNPIIGRPPTSFEPSAQAQGASMNYQTQPQLALPAGSTQSVYPQPITLPSQNQNPLNPTRFKLPPNH